MHFKGIKGLIEHQDLVNEHENEKDFNVIESWIKLMTLVFKFVSNIA